jgi:hypothetical protein
MDEESVVEERRRILYVKDLYATSSVYRKLLK